MNAPLTILQILGLVLAGLVAGMGLPMLALAGISGRMSDDPTAGFVRGLGLVLLAIAAYIAIRALTAA